MRIKIITGLAGAGKSTVLDSFEDMGYYCIDNMPPGLLLEFVRLYPKNQDYRLAVVMDLRLGEFFKDLDQMIDNLIKDNHDVEIIYVEASDEVLLNRFRSTRRNHPYKGVVGILDAIEKEKSEISGIRERADFILDTSNFNIHELKNRVHLRYRSDSKREYQVIFESFGFKKGILKEADYVFDLRILRNPFYQESLRELSGLDQRIRDYIFEDKRAATYYELVLKFLEFVVLEHKKENRHSIVVGLGCTGGKHRSVTFAYLLSEHFKGLGYSVVLKNRDLA